MIFKLGRWWTDDQLWRGFGPVGTNLFSTPYLGSISLWGGAWRGLALILGILWSWKHKERGVPLEKDSQWLWCWRVVVEDGMFLQLTEHTKKRRITTKKRSLAWKKQEGGVDEDEERELFMIRERGKEINFVAEKVNEKIGGGGDDGEEEEEGGREY